MSFYNLAKPFLMRLDPEKAHNMTLKALKAGVFPMCPQLSLPMLEQTLWGLKFPNPLGLAAGFDKNAEVIGPMLRMGFGYVEAGTVTPKPQEGNPKPRVFRDPDHNAVINRMGFPNRGATVFKDNLTKFLDKKPRPTGIIGINIGMNKTQEEPVKDYVALIRSLGPMADYFTINISSPNTPGLRDLQKRGPLLELLDGVKEARAKACGDHPPPVLVKFAPDLDEAQCTEMAKTALEAEIDGLVLGNTTLARPEFLNQKFSNENGGLSGQPLTQKSTDMIARFYQLTEGKLPIIGVGGVSSAQDAYDKIKAGASLIQIYSGLVFHGPALIPSILTGLNEYMQRDGYASLQDVIGVNHKNTL